MIVHGEGELLVPAHLNFGKFILDRVRSVKHGVTCLVNSTTGARMTYGEFTQYVVSLATSLTALGAGRGDTVALVSEPRTDFLPTSLAVILTGAAFTAIELECGRAILTHKFRMTRPKYVICSRRFWETHSDILKGFDFIEAFVGFEDIEDIELSIQTLVSRHRDVNVQTYEPAIVNGATDVAMVSYSSGTTGISKGVLLTHLNCIARTNIKEHIVSRFSNCEPLETGYFIGDVCCVYFASLMFSFLSTGKTLVCECSAKFMDLQILEDNQVNIVPTLSVCVDQFLDDKADQYDLSSLKLIYSAGARLHPTIMKAVRKRYPNIKLLQLYGTTETGLLTAQEPANTGTETVGVAVPCVTLKVVDVETRVTLGPNQRGEICARTPNMMKDYIGAKLQYLDDEGFYRTGDLGYYDDQKRFYLVDRLKDVIDCMGFQVCPGEIETVLKNHPAVREAAVVGKPAGSRGELPVGFVVLQPGAQATEAELIAYVAEEVSWYMRLVGGVRFVPEIPRNLRGKVLRQRLREMLELE